MAMAWTLPGIKVPMAAERKSANPKESFRNITTSSFPYSRYGE
jgi:hypothetical protein